MLNSVMEIRLPTKSKGLPSRTVLCCLSLLLVDISFSSGAKIRFASRFECDRYSLDALYHEKYMPVLEDILADSSEFVKQITERTEDSLISIMSKLPGRDSSDSEERRVHIAFEELKKSFQRSAKKIQQNLTESWKPLLVTNFDMLMDSSNSSLGLVQKHVTNVADACNEGKKALDTSMGTVVTSIKGVVRDGMKSIIITAKLEAQKQRNDTNSTSESNENPEQKNEPDLDKITRNITEEIVPGFLKTLTLTAFDNKVNLSKEVDVKGSERESVLDDMCFSLLMMRNRINAIVNSIASKDKGVIDLNRRTVYTYWADQTAEMYKEKIKKKIPTAKRKTNHKKLWSDEKTLADTLINLMQVYP